MGNPVGPGMFKAALADTPREAFNWRLVFSVICFGLMVSLAFIFNEYCFNLIISYLPLFVRNQTDIAPGTGCSKRIRRGFDRDHSYTEKLYFR
jgi:hypothetical protein